MKKTLLLAATLMLAFSSGAAVAQTDIIVRVRGTVASVAPRAVTVTTRTGETVKVALQAKTPVLGATAGTLADIKPGSFVGSAARQQPDGSLTALEVHVFAKRLGTPGAGSYPWDAPDGASMTNGNVGSASGVQGRVLSVTYPGGQKTITVPPDVPVILTDKGTRALLKPGARLVVSATKGADGALSAQWIVVGKNGVTPPM